MDEKNNLENDNKDAIVAQEESEKAIKNIKRFGTWQIILSSIFALFSVGILTQEFFWPGGELGIGAFFAIVIFGFVLFLMLLLLFAGFLIYKLSAFGRQFSLVLFIYLAISLISPLPIPLNVLQLISLPWLLMIFWPLHSLEEMVFIPAITCVIIVIIFAIYYLNRKDVKKQFLPKKIKFPGSGIFWGIIAIISPVVFFIAMGVMNYIFQATR